MSSSGGQRSGTAEGLRVAGNEARVVTPEVVDARSADFFPGGSLAADAAAAFVASGARSPRSTHPRPDTTAGSPPSPPPRSPSRDLAIGDDRDRSAVGADGTGEVRDEP